MALQMGAASLDITPATPTHLAGYGSRDKPHEGVHDPLHLRALMARGGDGGEVLAISADLLGFGPELDQRLRSLLARELNLDPQRILLAGSHTHSGPVYGGDHLNREWRERVESSALAAAALARTRLRTVTLRLARGTCGIGLNRRQVQPDGSIVLGHNPGGPVDPELLVVEARDESNRVVALVTNYACHGVVLGPRNFQISGDWCGVAAHALESARPGSAALFFNGGCGNIDPKVRVQAQFEPVEELAGEFVASVEAALRNAKTTQGADTVAAAELTVKMPHKRKLIEEGQGSTRRVLLRALRLGPVILCGFPGEMFCQTAQAVKAVTPAAWVMVASYIDSYHQGYVPLREDYAAGGYEVRVSPYNEEGEGILRQGLLDLLKMVRA